MQNSQTKIEALKFKREILLEQERRTTQVSVPFLIISTTLFVFLLSQENREPEWIILIGVIIIVSSLSLSFNRGRTGRINETISKEYERILKGKTKQH